MAKSVSELLKKRYINPLFGLPKERQVDIPQSTPSNMFLLKLDSSGSYIDNLRIQTVPLEISVEPKSEWAVIPSIGRNNPFYHYTGGETTLTFTLDWYSVDPLRQDVIEKCRWVEALSKADAYREAPPRVVLIYGEMFRFATWIVESAQYRVSLFDKSNGMLPRQAYQELILKRVTDKNISHSEMRNSN